ncbi:MAG: glycosyltransferase [Clostridium sp.]|nr:glycosyltransferase [Clostridium sp.]
MDTDPSPIITIATVTYNAENTLPGTLESVARQDYPHVEHLIIDGCSKDHTMELIHRYVDENSLKETPHDIRVVKEPDRGLYDAMNKALAQAQGDYICFLNAGDRLHATDTLSRIAGCIRSCGKERRPAVVYGETDIVDLQGNFIRHRRLQAPEQLHWKSFRQGMLVCHQSFYARTDLTRETAYDLRYRFSADFDWCVRLMRKAEHLGSPLCNSRLVLTDYLNEGMTTHNHSRSLWERFRIMGRHYGLCRAIALHLGFVWRALIRP